MQKAYDYVWFFYVFQGTFNPYLGLNATEFCTSCTAGQYCDSEGLNTTTGPCDPGFYCPGGQNSSRPAGLECPVAHYCPLNSSQPLPCSNGTFMNHTMADQCYTCPQGWWVPLNTACSSLKGGVLQVTVMKQWGHVQTSHFSFVAEPLSSTLMWTTPTKYN